MPSDRPNLDQAARDALDDLGLIDDERTEHLMAPDVAGVEEAMPA
jgi:hypothetical protein